MCNSQAPKGTSRVYIWPQLFLVSVENVDFDVAYTNTLLNTIITNASLFDQAFHRKKLIILKSTWTKD